MPRFSHKLFHYDDTTKDDEDICPLLDLIQTTLVDHLGRAATGLSSFSTSCSVLNCLIMLCQLYRNYYLDQSCDWGADHVNPLLKKHLKAPHSLANFLRELDAKFDNSPAFIELFSKFLVYISLTIEGLNSRHKQHQEIVDVNKLKELFKWSTSNFNITDLHIDSISICKSLKSRPTNENSLDNLLVLVVNSEQAAKEAVPALAQAIKFCACHMKRLVNTLNQVANTAEESILNMPELKSTCK